MKMVGKSEAARDAIMRDLLQLILENAPTDIRAVSLFVTDTEGETELIHNFPKESFPSYLSEMSDLLSEIADNAEEALLYGEEE